MKSRLVAGAAGATLFVIGVAPAGASVLAGDITNPPTVGCNSAEIYVQGSAVGHDGVITEWTLNQQPGTIGKVALKLVGINDFSGQSHVHSSSPLETSVPGLQTMQTRLSVSADEHLGLWHSSGPVQLCKAVESFAGGDATYWGISQIANPPGGTAIVLEGDPAPTLHFGVRLVVQAKIEPDDDSDGFGDESQDNCLGFSGPSNGCLPPLVIERPLVLPDCKVPSLKSKTKSAAKGALEKANCKLATTRLKKIKKFTTKKKKGRVASQTVKAGTVLPFGSTVGITVYAKK